MNLFWILLPPDRNYIPSFSYNKERKWCESASCRLPSEFISILQTRSPVPPPSKCQEKTANSVLRALLRSHDVQLTPPLNIKKNGICSLLLSLETSLVVINCMSGLNPNCSTLFAHVDVLLRLGGGYICVFGACSNANLLWPLTSDSGCFNAGQKIKAAGGYLMAA